MPGQSDHPHVQGEVFSAELGADARLLCGLQELGFSNSTSRNACPRSFPCVGSPSR